MSNALPGLMQFPLIPQSELISDGQSHLSAFQFRKTEPSHSLLIQTKVPSNSYVGLSLTFLQPLVVVRLDLYERTKYVLVLIGVFIPRQNRLRFIVNTWFLKIFESRIRIITPQIFREIGRASCRERVWTVV